jgi:PleD family two-component response regulator
MSSSRYTVAPKPSHGLPHAKGGEEHLYTQEGISFWHGLTGASLAMATILIIDNEDTMRVLLRSTLQSAGHAVIEAPNGRIGLDLYRHRPTDLVITDIAMPELNGLDMMLELTREFLHTKVIAISGVGGKRMSWIPRNSLGHGGHFTSLLV